MADKKEVKGDKKEVNGDDAETYSSNPKKEMNRVFRVERPPSKKAIITLMQKKRVVDGTELDELAVSKDPNAAQQYVLDEGSIEYDKQLKVLRAYEAKGFIKEIDPKLLGIPWIPEAQLKLAEAEALVKKLKKLV